MTASQEGSVLSVPILLNRVQFISAWGIFSDYPDSSSASWKRASLDRQADFIYTSKSALPDELYIFSESSVSVFNKKSQEILIKKLPEEMSPAFSFTAGSVANTSKVIFYALHHDKSKEIQGEFGHTEVWTSEDLGVTWKRVNDPLVTNSSARNQAKLFNDHMC